MEKSDIIQFGGFLATYAAMVLARIFLPSPWDMAVGVGGIVLFIIAIVVQEYYVRITLSHYAHLDAMIRPHWRRQHIYYVRAESQQIAPHRYRTILYLGFPFKHKEYSKYGRIWWIVITHNMPWNTRVKLRHGKAAYGGVWVDHAQTDYVTLYEYNAPIVFKGQPIPWFELVEGGGDYPEMSQLIRQHYIWKKELGPRAPIIQGAADGGSQEAAAEAQVPDDEEEERDRALASIFHQRMIELEEIAAQQRDELIGRLKSEMGFSRAVKESLLAISQQQMGILNAVKALGAPKIPWTFIGIVAIAIAFITAMGLNPEIPRQMGLFLQNPVNQAFIVIVLIIMAIIIWLVFRRRGRER
jgi:hypothetical protein